MQGRDKFQLIKEHKNFRAYFADSQIRAVFVVSGASVLYGAIAPIIMPIIGLRTRENAILQFSPLFFGCILSLLVSAFLLFSKNSREGKYADQRGVFCIVPTVLLALSAATFATLSEYVSVKEDGVDGFMVFIIVSLILAAAIYIHPMVMLVAYTIYAATFIVGTIHLHSGSLPPGTIYNLIVFAIMVNVLTNARYYLGMRHFIAQREIARMQKESEKFMASVTHEMRTPLNAVLGKNELIRRESKEAETVHLSEEIASSGKILLSLINDILDLSKIRAGRMNFVPGEYRTGEIYNEIIEIMRSEAQSHGLKFEVQVKEGMPSVLYGDEVRIRQVLLNLLSNAIKYTHEGTVSMRIDFENEGDVCHQRFAVIDTGIGIQEEDLPNLMQEFVRVDERRNRKTMGTGLGLSITSLLLHMMNSQLEVTSEYGKGSCFSFSLDQKIVDASPIPVIQDLTSEQKHLLLPDLKLLIVDDNRVNYTVAKGLLRYHQVLPTYAESGEKCLQLLKDNHYDLIFMDHMMPQMSGPETLDKIRELYPAVYMNTPIIALTANDSSDADKTYREMGFAGFLAKPITPRQLEARLRKFSGDGT